MGLVTCAVMQLHYGMATAHIYNTSDDQKAVLDSKKAALEHYIKVSRLTSSQRDPFFFRVEVCGREVLCSMACVAICLRYRFLNIFASCALSAAVRGATEGTHRQAHGIQRSVTVTAVPH